MKVTYHDLDFEIDVTHFDPGVPPFTTGLPEDCHEGERAGLEFTIASVEGRYPEDEAPLRAYYADDEGLADAVVYNLLDSGDCHDG